MKKQSKMVELQLNKKEISQKSTPSKKAHILYGRTIASIETIHQSTIIHHGNSPQFLYTIIQGILH